MDAHALRLAQAVAVVVSAGFAFGGVIGVVYSDDPAWLKAVAFAMLAVLFALHVRNCVRRADGKRPPGWAWTLGAQAVLTAAGLHWFAGTWYGNTGFLAAAVLLLLRSPWAFAAVLVAQFFSAMTVRPTLSESLYLVFGQAAFVGVALYAVVRIADLILDLRRTQADLAAAAVAGERLAFAERLNDRVGTGLEQVVSRGEAVLTADDPWRARQELESGLGTARTALAEVRSVSREHSVEENGRGPSAGLAVRVAGDLTTRVATMLVVATLSLMIIPHEVRHLLQIRPTPAGAVLFVIALLGFLLLFLRACLPGGERWRLWVFAGLVLVTYAPTAVLGGQVWYVATFLPGAAVILLRGPARWIAAVAITAGDTAFHVLVSHLAGNALDVAYGFAYVADRGIVVYALWRMAALTVELRAARAELARAEVARERLRFARDLHDLLGYGLSVVVLKAELAFRLLDRDRPEDARRELSGGLDAARQVLRDIGDVAAGYTAISLAAEVASARAVLSAAGVEVTGEVTGAALPAEIDAVLATALREGVTNLLRHSDARHCALELTADDEQVRLSLRNDGVAAAVPKEPGAGIGNLTHRLEALGGGCVPYGRAGSSS